ncbi:MAG: hypothetical protein ACHQ53_05930 [Polyangiales bacterium]
MMPEEKNLLLSPEHPDFRRVKIGKPSKFTFDGRMWKPVVRSVLRVRGPLAYSPWRTRNSPDTMSGASLSRDQSHWWRHYQGMRDGGAGRTSDKHLNNTQEIRSMHRHSAFIDTRPSHAGGARRVAGFMLAIALLLSSSSAFATADYVGTLSAIEMRSGYADTTVYRNAVVIRGSDGGVVCVMDGTPQQDQVVQVALAAFLAGRTVTIARGGALNGQYKCYQVKLQ